MEDRTPAAAASTPDPCPAQFTPPDDARNLSESAVTAEAEMEISSSISNSNGGGRCTQIAITITKPAQEMDPKILPPPQVSSYPGILYLVYAAMLMYMFPSMVALVSLKFQNNHHSAFESNRSFVNMAVVAYIIAITMSVVLFCLKARLESKMLSPMYYKILRSVFYFWALLAPLSFVLVLFLPHGCELIGYTIVLTLLILVMACSFSNYIKLLWDASINLGSSLSGG